jgi:hypothetical protein
VKSDRHILFLEDYANRSRHSLSTFLYLACLAVRFRD